MGRGISMQSTDRTVRAGKRTRKRMNVITKLTAHQHEGKRKAFKTRQTVIGCSCPWPNNVKKNCSVRERKLDQLLRCWSIYLSSYVLSPRPALASTSRNGKKKKKNWVILVFNHGCIIKGPENVFLKTLMHTPHPDQLNQNPWKEGPANRKMDCSPRLKCLGKAENHWLRRAIKRTSA